LRLCRKFHPLLDKATEDKVIPESLYLGFSDKDFRNATTRKCMPYVVDCQVLVGYICDLLNMWISDHTRTHRNDLRSSAAMCRAGCSIDQCSKRCMNIKGSISCNIYDIDKDMTQRAMLYNKPIIPATGLHACATQLHDHH